MVRWPCSLAWAEGLSREEEIKVMRRAGRGEPNGPGWGLDELVSVSWLAHTAHSRRGLDSADGMGCILRITTVCICRINK